MICVAMGVPAGEAGEAPVGEEGRGRQGRGGDAASGGAGSGGERQGGRADVAGACRADGPRAPGGPSEGVQHSAAVILLGLSASRPPRTTQLPPRFHSACTECVLMHAALNLPRLPQPPCVPSSPPLECLSSHTSAIVSAPRSADVQRLQKQIAQERERIAALEASRLPMERELAEAKAAAEMRSEELESVRAQAARWEKRTQQLLDKYNRVDAQEHEAVKAKLEVTCWCMEDGPSMP